MADKIEIAVPGELDGARADKALASLLRVSRAAARSLVDKGVTVDGAAVKAGTPVSVGSILSSPRPEARSELVPEPVPFETVHEDDELLIVCKPAGIVAHPGSGRATGTLAAGLLHRYPELRGVGQPGRWGLVHRLDKDTSGLLVVARTRESYEALTGMLRRREIRREYVALAHGALKAPTGAIDAPIGRDPARPTRRAVTAGGKEAVTRYEVAETYAAADCTLLDVRLETGRTHQIRVHLSAIGHPLIGDRLYGGGPSLVKSPRVFLHASRVELRRPSSGFTITASAPLPDDLRAVLAGLGC